MDKKFIGIGAAIILVIVAGVFMFNGLKKNDGEIDTGGNSVIDNTTPNQEEIADAKEIQEYMPDKTIDEIIEINKIELTDEKQKIFDDVINNYTLPEVDEIISTPDDQDLENETPEIVYKDKEGNIHTVDITEEEWNMTDEDAEEEMRRIEEEMDQRMKDYAERWDKKQNGEDVDPITPPSGDYEDDIQYDPSTENDTYDPYRGYGSYDAYIDHVCQELPQYSREEIIDMFPDPATGEAGPATEANMRDGLLSGN